MKFTEIIDDVNRLERAFGIERPKRKCKKFNRYKVTMPQQKKTD